MDLWQVSPLVAATSPAERTEVQKYLAEKFGAILKVSSHDLKAADPAYAKQEEKYQSDTFLLQARKIPDPKIQALWDRGEASPTYILRRGSPSNFGPLVQPGVPSVLITGLKPYQITEPWPGARAVRFTLIGLAAIWFGRRRHSQGVSAWGTGMRSQRR